MNALSFKKDVFLIGLALLFFSQFTKAQLTTSTVMSPQQLVQNVLLGSGVTATNIVYNGASLSRGTFDGSASNIGLNAGVVLASGDVANATGPNDQDAVSTDNGLLGDVDLNAIMFPTLSFDASILEFDFIPTSDTVKFRYVFGSDEYMEFVSTLPGGINDGFGFFISGPGISGPFSNNAKNIALIPGTSLPVTMFNLNLNNNGAYYFDNGDGQGTGTAPDGLTVQYDGFTVPLTAITNVQCGQTYHIKLAIADGGDKILDSGVFLEAGSFSSVGNVLISSNTFLGGAIAGNDTTIYEGCGFASILFNRGINNITNPDTVIMTYSGTATNGIDFSFVSDTLYFSPGQDSAFVTINSLPDGLIEGMETIIISFYNPTPCNNYNILSLTLYIVDSPPLSLTLNNDTLLNCPMQNIPLIAIATGGVAIGNYNYAWTNSTSTTDTAHVSPIATTTYYATVTDSCGNTVSDSVKILIVPYTPMQLTLNNDTAICAGNTLLLDVNISGGSLNYIYSWNPNISLVDSVTIMPTSSATYSVTVTDVCGYTISDGVDVTVYPIQADFDYNAITNQNLQFDNLSIGAVSYLWNFGDGSTDSVSTSENPLHEYATDGIYTVTLVSVNSEGCPDTMSKTIEVLPDFYFYYPNAFTPDANGSNDLFMGYGVGIKSYRMRIFDRWGESLFDTSEIETGWDGMYKGKKLPSEVYIVVFNLEDYHRKGKKIIGHVNLIR